MFNLIKSKKSKSELRDSLDWTIFSTANTNFDLTNDDECREGVILVSLNE